MLSFFPSKRKTGWLECGDCSLHTPTCTKKDRHGETERERDGSYVGNKWVVIYQKKKKMRWLHRCFHIPAIIKVRALESEVVKERVSKLKHRVRGCFRKVDIWVQHYVLLMPFNILLLTICKYCHQTCYQSTLTYTLS